MEKFKKMSIRFFFLILILPSCIEAENDFEFESVKKIIDKHELELVGFDKDYNQGLKLDDLSEFETLGGAHEVQDTVLQFAEFLSIVLC
jgi:hypothetical protein